MLQLNRNSINTTTQDATKDCFIFALSKRLSLSTPLQQSPQDQTKPIDTSNDAIHRLLGRCRRRRRRRWRPHCGCRCCGGCCCYCGCRCCCSWCRRRGLAVCGCQPCAYANPKVPLMKPTKGPHTATANRTCPRVAHLSKTRLSICIGSSVFVIFARKVVAYINRPVRMHSVQTGLR